MKIDWKRAAAEALKEEVRDWKIYQWQKADKRIRAFKALEKYKERGSLNYYLSMIQPDFGPTALVIPLKRKVWLEPATTEPWYR